MMKLKCPGCQRTLNVGASLAGKTVACPACKQALKIPAQMTPSSTVATKLASENPTVSERGIVSKPVAIASVPTQSPRRMATSPKTTAELGTGNVDLDSINFASLPAAPKPVAKPKSMTLNAIDHLPQLNQKISELLSSPIPRHKSTGLYRLGIAGMAFFMMAMPLAYVALIAVVTYGVYHYTFVVFPGLFEYLPRGRAAIFMFLVYSAPIVAGVITVIFMVKPVFVSVVWDRDKRQRSIRRETEPALFNLVEKICESVGAPKPSRVDIDCNVNASASLGNGLKGLFGNQLVLTIGMPLVADMSARQFAGVLAHEFGHFSQGAGMRSSSIVRSINYWFYRVVYQRDGIDQLLDESAAESESMAITLVLGFSSVCVWVTRRILWCFMMVAHLVSSFMLRQMEFDADRYEAGLGGSMSFKEASCHLRLLGFSQEKTMVGLLNLAMKEAVLVDNIPMMVAHVRRSLPHDEMTKVTRSMKDESTGLFDTHPCDAERIEAAEKLSLPGVFNLDLPATNLFRNFDSLCRNVTQDFYRNQIGRMVALEELQPTAMHLQKVLATKV